MTQASPRLIHLLSFILAAIFVGVSFFLQFKEGINPCPLCILQRVTLMLLGVIFLIGAIFSFKKCGQLIIGFLTLLFSGLGIFLAGRQVWLQHLPPSQSTDCGVSLQYMLQVLPLDQVLQKVMQGTAECSEVSWKFLYLSLAEWSLLCFVFFLLISLFQLKRFIKSTDK